MATKITDMTLENAYARLADVDEELQAMDRSIEETNSALGDALAAMRAGDKSAERRAGELSLRRAEVERKRHDLSLTRASIAASINRMEADAAAAAIEAARTAFDALTAQGRDLEETLCGQMQAAGDTAQALRHVRLDWQNARNMAAQAGHDVAGVEEPRDPTPLFQPHVIPDAKGALSNWLKPAWRYPHGKPSLFVGTYPQPKPFLVFDEDRMIGTIRQVRNNEDGAA